MKEIIKKEELDSIDYRSVDFVMVKDRIVIMRCSELNIAEDRFYKLHHVNYLNQELTNFVWVGLQDIYSGAKKGYTTITEALTEYMFRSNVQIFIFDTAREAFNWVSNQLN